MKYNKQETIRTAYDVEVIYQTGNGFIGRLPEVEYKQSNGTWKAQGSRWLINVSDAVEIMDNGFKSARL